MTKSRSVVQTTKASRSINVKYRRPNLLDRRYPHLRLPFVNQRDFWNMPGVDGYGPGFDMGVSAALAFLKSRRATEDCGSGVLQHVVLSILVADIDPNEHGQQGIIVGFFFVLDHWLHTCVTLLGDDLDLVTESEIERRMTRAANCSADEYAACINAMRSERQKSKA